MNEFLSILAISVITIGFLVLVGVALWLATERRRHLSAGQYPPARPLAVEQPAASPASAALGKPAAQPAATGTPEAPKDPAGEAASAGSTPQKEAHPSGEYPSAELYDQTLLPQPPRRRTRQQPKE